MLKKLWTNGFWLMWCMALLSAVGAINYPPLAGAQGVDSYTKLMLHADGSDQGTSFTDSETTPKTVTNTESYDSYTKLMLHADGSDQGTSFTDSSSGAKTVTNTESYDSYTKLMLHIENNVTDSAAGKTVTNNNVTFTNSAYKMGGYSGVFNGSKIQPR